MNLSWAQVRKTNETVSIERLHTAFPYGLDDKIGEEYHLQTTDMISLKIQSLYNIELLSGREFLFKLNRYLIQDTLILRIFVRAQISLFNKRSLKNIACSIGDDLIRLTPF